MRRNAARHAGRHSISRHEGALKWCTYTHICYTITNTHTRRPWLAKTVVHTSDLTSPAWHVGFYGLSLCPSGDFICVLWMQTNHCRSGTPQLSYASVYAVHECVFLPSAVSTVDIASERQLVGLKVVLSLLCDADLFFRGFRWHVIIHLGCK